MCCLPNAIYSMPNLPSRTRIVLHLVSVVQLYKALGGGWSPEGMIPVM